MFVWSTFRKILLDAKSREHVPATLLLGQPGLPVRCCCCGLSLSLRDDIGLVDSALDDLLLLGVEVLCEVLIQRGLLLLKLCSLSVVL